MSCALEGSECLVAAVRRRPRSRQTAGARSARCVGFRRSLHDQPDRLTDQSMVRSGTVIDDAMRSKTVRTVS